MSIAAICQAIKQPPKIMAQLRLARQGCDPVIGRHRILAHLFRELTLTLQLIENLMKGSCGI